MTKYIECQTLANKMNLKIEPAGKKHDYEAAMEGLATPKYVVKHQNPSYDIKWFLGARDMHAWLKEVEHEYQAKGFVTGL